jgi:hypothetical protein
MSLFVFAQRGVDALVWVSVFVDLLEVATACLFIEAAT